MLKITHNPFSPSARLLAIAALAGASIGLCTPANAMQPASTAPNGSSLNQPDAAQDMAIYEHRMISTVLVRPVIINNEESILTIEAQQEAINNIRSRPGTVFDAQTVRDDIRRLNRLGSFSRIEVFAGINDDGSIELVFEVLERRLVIDVQVVGNEQLNDAQLSAVVDVVTGTPIDRFQIERSARRIENIYRQKGYYHARVLVDEDELDDTGLVLFRVLEGDRLKVTAIRFSGHESFTTKQLRREVNTKTSSFFRKGQLDDDKLDADIANLIEFYKNRGYLDIRADRLIQPAPNGRETIVTYLIEEGPLFTLRSIQISIESEDDNPPVFNQAQIAGLISIKAGDVYSVRELNNSINTIRSAYGQMGYVDAADTNARNIFRIEKRDPTQPLVDLIVVINEGNRYLAGEIIIQGNHLTRQEVIRRHIEIRPTRPLDTTAMNRSKTRLRRLQLFNARSGAKITPQEPGVEFFAEVWDDEFLPRASRPKAPHPKDPRTRITLDPTDESNYRDVLIEIEETNTGSFDIGGAVSSDSGIIGRIALTQRNFDVRDTPDSPGEFFSGRAFRGGGQTFQIEMLPGNRVQTYSIGLTEPFLNESSYSGSANLFFRNRDFDEFDEQRLGARFGLGRRFGTRWNGNLTLRAEQVELSDIEADRPVDIFAVEDANLLIGLKAGLQRTTLDSLTRPTKGSRTSISLEQVAGDFEFTKLTVTQSTFIPLREDYLGRSTILNLRGRLGYIPQGRENAPTYERFYMGGQSFRGFDFRTVSPKGIRNDNGLPSEDSVGGTFQAFVSAQIEQPIYEDIFSLVAFIDAGTVSFNPGFDELRVSVGFGIRFHVPALSPAPLAFDFGFPILKEEDDDERLFTFTVDLPFN
ncbi:MAG: BamA/TamA family outer membrane protein [Phycisphaerales bacterium]|nr:BamA/TamA family outer membrane protein [Phycisphaerales bacterium]